MCKAAGMFSCLKLALVWPEHTGAMYSFGILRMAINVSFI